MPEDYERIANSIRELPLIKKWQEATKHFLPRSLSIEYRSEQHDVLLSLSLWRSPIYERKRWSWNRFYGYVVNETWEKKDLGPEYYPEAINRIQDALPINPESITEFTLSLLDGIFVQTYNSALKMLQSVPHTIKNALKHLTVTSGGDEKNNLGAVAVELQHLSKALLDVEPARFREFDLYSVLSDLLTKCCVLYPDISFELPELSANRMAIICGSERHIVQAIWDIIHNSVDAVRTLNDNRSRKICISLIQRDEGMQVVVTNTGPPSEDPAAKGFGIGSQSVDQIVCGLHHGRVSHGPIDDGGPLRYEWRLFFPFDPLQESE
jgi:hypothetical protein